MFPVDFIIFLQIILFLFITPGPPRVVIVSHTINYGLKNSVWTAFGDISANTCQGILAVFFVGTFLKDNPEALNFLKWAGIFYIIYLAYDTYTAKIRSIDSKITFTKSKLSFYKDGFLVAGLSPKAIVFFTTIFISFMILVEIINSVFNFNDNICSFRFFYFNDLRFSCRKNIKLFKK